MEDASRSSASGAMRDASTDKSAKGAPRPNASKMTTAERDAYRKEVAKEAKP